MSEACARDTEEAYALQLGSLAKIPASRLGKGVTATLTAPDGSCTDVTTVFPPAFTVVLGGLPTALAHRLLASDSPNARIFAQSSASLPATPTAAAVIAAPPKPAEVGGLFSPRIGNGEMIHSVLSSTVHGLVAPAPLGDTAALQRVHEETRGVTLDRSSSILPEVDESTAAVAELTSEQASVSIVQGEPFEEINAIQLSRS